MTSLMINHMTNLMINLMISLMINLMISLMTNHMINLTTNLMTNPMIGLMRSHMRSHTVNHMISLMTSMKNHTIDRGMKQAVDHTRIQSHPIPPVVTNHQETNMTCHLRPTNTSQRRVTQSLAGTTLHRPRVRNAVTPLLLAETTLGADPLWLLNQAMGTKLRPT